jgi:hypothetical protein
MLLVPCFLIFVGIYIGGLLSYSEFKNRISAKPFEDKIHEGHMMDRKEYWTKGYKCHDYKVAPGVEVFVEGFMLPPLTHYCSKLNKNFCKQDKRWCYNLIITTDLE